MTLVWTTEALRRSGVREPPSVRPEEKYCSRTGTRPYGERWTASSARSCI